MLDPATGATTRVSTSLSSRQATCRMTLACPTWLARRTPRKDSVERSILPVPLSIHAVHAIRLRAWEVPVPRWVMDKKCACTVHSFSNSYVVSLPPRLIPSQTQQWRSMVRLMTIRMPSWRKFMLVDPSRRPLTPSPL